MRSLLSGSIHFLNNSLISSLLYSTTRMGSNFFNSFSSCNDGPSKQGTTNKLCFMLITFVLLLFNRKCLLTICHLAPMCLVSCHPTICHLAFAMCLASSHPTICHLAANCYLAICHLAIFLQSYFE